MRRLTDNGLWAIRGEKSQGQSLRRWNRVLPRPQEGYPFWARYCGDKFLWTFLANKVASEKEKASLRRAVGRTLYYQGRQRFVCKLTGPPRIHFLRSIFPDAIFVHLVRDGRAVVNSLLNVDFWTCDHRAERPFWTGGLTESDLALWQQYGDSSLVLTAIQWRRVLKQTRAEGAELPPNQFIEIRYEDFIADPHAQVSSLLEVCGLTDSNRVHAYVDVRSRTLVNMNYKYKERSLEDISTLEAVMQDELRRWGYMGQGFRNPSVHRSGCVL